MSVKIAEGGWVDKNTWGQNSTIMEVVSQLLKASERRERAGHLVVQYSHRQEGTRGVKLGDCSVQEGVNSLAGLGDGQGRPHGTGFQVGLGYLFPAPGALTGGVRAHSCKATAVQSEDSFWELQGSKESWRLWTARGESAAMTRLGFSHGGWFGMPCRRRQTFVSRSRIGECRGY